jgi:hypothetical protein
MAVTQVERNGLARCPVIRLRIKFIGTARPALLGSAPQPETQRTPWPAAPRSYTQ